MSLNIETLTINAQDLNSSGAPWEEAPAPKKPKLVSIIFLFIICDRRVQPPGRKRRRQMPKRKFGGDEVGLYGN